MDRKQHVAAIQAYGETLEEAFNNAWEEGKQQFHGAKTLEVLRILVHGENPISGYSVILSPVGGGH